MAVAPPDNLDALIAELSALTGQPPASAEGYLRISDYNLEAAASLFFEGHDPQNTADAAGNADIDMSDNDNDEPQPADPRTLSNVPAQGGGRTLGGDYVPSQPAASSSAAPAQRQRGVAGIRSLRDLQGGASGSGGHGHAHNDDDDDDDRQHDFFTGGEKSGLAVQNPGQSDPRDHINNILKRARQNAERPGGDDDEQPTSHFTGTGMTLGGDDAPSRAIPDPHASTPRPAPRAHRELHLWRDGFSVDDGPLHRYDDPNNARTLEMIHSGHAPLHILNVEHGQEVDVAVTPHKEEDYKQPKKKYVPFGGSGQRLGAETPGASSSTSTSAAPPATAAASSASSSSAPLVNVDSSAPTVTLQIRLGDGTRLQSRFNTNHTVGDVYAFVNAASADGASREYVLMTTFPSKELGDKGVGLGDVKELAKGGVVVQRWK